MEYITFEEVCDRQCGRVILANGCCYFVDMDGDLAYYRQMNNGLYEDQVEYVDTDGMDEETEAFVVGIHQVLASDLPLTDAF